MIRSIQTLGTLLLVILAFSGCQNPATNPDDLGQGQIKGYVFSSQGAPVGGATVSTDPTTRTVRTDEDGKFLIPIVPAGDYVVTAKHATLGSGRVSVEVQARKNSLVDITLGRGNDGGTDDSTGNGGGDRDTTGGGDRDTTGGGDRDTTGGGDNDSVELGGLLVHLKLDGNAVDAARTLMPGNIDGATPTTDRFGNSRAAMSFDGQNDAIRFSPTQRAELAGLPITWSFWIKPRRSALGSSNMQAPLGLYLHPVGDGIVFLWEEGKFSSVYTTTGFRNYVRVDRELNTDDQWHHVVMRVTEGGMDVFYDGNAVGRSEWTGQATTAFSQQPLQLGIVRSVSPREQLRPFAGALDDVMIFDRPITNEEIARLYYRR